MAIRSPNRPAAAAMTVGMVGPDASAAVLIG